MRYLTVKGTMYDPAAPDQWHSVEEMVQAADETAAADKALLLAADGAGLDVAQWVSEPTVTDAPADIINLAIGAARFPGW